MKEFYKKSLDLSLAQVRCGAAEERPPSKRQPGPSQGSDRRDTPAAPRRVHLGAGRPESSCRQDAFFAEFFSKNYSSIVQMKKRPSIKPLVPARQGPPGASPANRLAQSERRLGLGARILGPPCAPARPRRTTPARDRPVPGPLLEAQLGPRKPQRSDIVVRNRAAAPAGGQDSDSRPAAARYWVPRSPLPVARFSTDLPSQLSHPVAELSPNHSQALAAGDSVLRRN